MNEIELINTIKSQVPNALFPEHQSNIASPTLVTALAKDWIKNIN